jgi:hypothetical protein
MNIINFMQHIVLKTYIYDHIILTIARPIEQFSPVQPLLHAHTPGLVQLPLMQEGHMAVIIT